MLGPNLVIVLCHARLRALDYERMKKKILATSIAIAAFAAISGAQTYSLTAVGAGVSNTALPKQDIFITTGYTSGGSSFDKASFERWNDGKLTNNQGTYGWNTNINIETGSAISGNPDRGDDTTGFGGNTSLANIFSNTNKNLNYIIDGEGVTPDYTLDMLYGSGQTLTAVAGKAHLLVLERGMNSSIRVRGLYQGQNGLVATSGSITLAENQQTSAGFSIDTTEIDGAQRVGGWGVDVSSLSAESLGQGLLGFRFEASQGLGHNGPDFVGAASLNPVPEPGTLIAVALGAVGLISRRRKA